MKKYQIYQVDAFTTELFRGNPAGVVPNADGLTDEQMQNIARELNNSETAFILEPTENTHDVWIRFFTPTIEVPICGHATIAAHYVRSIENNYESRTVIQKVGAGILQVEIIKENSDYKIIMTQGKIEFNSPFESGTNKKICEALYLSENDLDERCPIQIVSTGHSKVLIGIKSQTTLDSLKPNIEALTGISKEIKCNGYFVFTFDTNEDSILTKGRMFAPAIGINEDPVTGNANGPLGAYLVKHKLVTTNGKTFSFKGKQGEAINRTGIVEVEVEIENDFPKKVKIGGNAKIVFKTEIEI
ncbi:MAG: PhzF family isomerase [Ignavibacteriales bacterium]|nr:PhzF family isomerase [Ignavibacteriales bacterium]